MVENSDESGFGEGQEALRAGPVSQVENSILFGVTIDLPVFIDIHSI